MLVDKNLSLPFSGPGNDAAVIVGPNPDDVWRVSNGRCSCGFPGCDHLKLAIEVQQRSRTGGRCYSLSSIHKEFRRGDLLRASSLIPWLSPQVRPSRIKAYTRSVMLEETRNVRLIELFQRDYRRITPDQAVRLLAASTKKWELDCRADAFRYYAEGYSAPLSLPDDEAAQQKVLESVRPGDPAWMFRLFWSVAKPAQTLQAKLKFLPGNSPEGVRVELLKSALARLLQERGRWESVMANCRCTGHWWFYVLKLMIEMVCGFWSEQANHENPLVREVPPKGDCIIPTVEWYVHDPHTRIGRNLWRAHWSDIRPGRRPPENIDPRWSGMIVGVFWRELAARQFPKDYRWRHWEEVKWPDGLFVQSIALDRFFYPQFMRSVE